MIVGIIVLLVFLLCVGLVGYICYKQINKTSKHSFETVKEEKTTKEFLAFSEILDNGVIDLGNFQYRILIECSSINYHLRSAEEQNIIEMTYMRFLHNWNFPYTIHIATRKFNFQKIIENYKKQNTKMLEEFENNEFLRILSEDQLKYLKFLEQSQTNIRQKRKYIIVPYDLNTSEVSKLSDTEKREFAINQIMSRANLIIDDFSSLKIESRILSKKEVIEVIFSALNRDKSDLAEAVGDEIYNEIIVDSDNINCFDELSSLDLAGLTLTEAINKLSMQPTNRKIQEIIVNLEHMKNEIL